MEMPKHIAISLDDISDWCRDKSMGIEECCSRCFGLVSRLLAAQISSNIPIFTIYLLPEDVKTSTEDYMIFCDCMANFFSELAGSSIVSGHKIKISIFGKWYNLPGKAVESLKMAIEATKEYDSFFANFCINYDGQEEIVDACRLIAKQVQLGKIDAEMITKGTIKENIYSSYFLPPDMVLIYGERKLAGLLLWDSATANVVFTGKSFMEFEEGDVERLNRNLYK